MGNPIRHLELVQPGNPAKDAIAGIELLEQTLKDSAKSIEKQATTIAESLKKINTTTKKGQEATAKAATNTKKLTTAQKNNDKIAKDLIATKEKLRTIEGIQNKGLVKNRIELQKANKVVKQNTQLSMAQKGSYDALAISLNKDIAKWKQMSTAERTSTTAGKKLTANIKQQDAALKKLDKQLGRSQRNVGNYGSAFTSLGAAMGVTMGAAGVFMILKNAVGVIAGFEKEMAKVKAISGATAEEFQLLKKQAEDLGGSTLFTAQQVASLEVAYSKLGFTTQEILNATAATLDLAVATDSDLSSAAEVAGSTLRGFGLEASKMNRVVDIMAKGFTTSALDIENFRESMKLVAPIAKAANIPLEVTTNALGKLADAGLKGSIGATGFKNVLLALADESSKLSKHLGFTVKNSDDLQKAFNQLSGESLDLADAQKLIDKRGQAALIVLSQHKDIANLLADSYKNVDGSAREMAEIMEGTLSASVTFLGSAWDGLMLKMSGSKGVFKGVIDGFTYMLNFMANGVKSTNPFDDLNEGIETNRILYEESLKRGDLAGAEFYKKALDRFESELEKEQQLTEDAEKADIDKKASTTKKANSQRNADRKAANAKLLAIDADFVEDDIEVFGDGYDQEYLDNKAKNEEIEKSDKELHDTLKADADAKYEEDIARLNKEKEEEDKARKEKLQKEQAALNEMRAALDNQYNTFESGLARSVSTLGSAILEINEIFKNGVDLDEIGDLFQVAFASIGKIGTALFEQRTTEINAELEQLQTNKAAELALVEGNEEKTAAVNKKYAAEEKKLKIEKFKNDKKAAIFSAVINTALGVTAALSQLPPLSYILAAITAAAGAVEIAAIASTPVPKYEKGGHGLLGKSGEHGIMQGKRHKDGGNRIDRVGEGEKGEYFGIINRDKTDKYQSELPSIFDSLNNGNFEDIWQKTNDSLNVSVNDTYGKKMYNEMQNKETIAGDKRIIKRGNRTLILN